MEVQGSNPNKPTPAYKRYLEAQRDLFLSNRERVREGREDRLSEALETRDSRVREQEVQRQDRLEVSELAERSPANDPARGERVEELRQLYTQGQLLTPERLERTAEGLLRSE